MESGSRDDDPTDVLKQVFAIWTAIKKHGIKYSSVTEVPGGPALVNSQFVRFLDQSVTNTQANCVDGSVLFASLLRKIGINPFLVAVPGHMYIGFYLNNSEDENEREYVGLETTMRTIPIGPTRLQLWPTNSAIRSKTAKRGKALSRP